LKQHASDVCRRMRKPEKVVGNVFLLGVMANTDMTGLLLSSLSYWNMHTLQFAAGSGQKPLTSRITVSG